MIKSRFNSWLPSLFPSGAPADGGSRHRSLSGSPAGYDRPVSAPVVVIIAAGEGTRMRSATPKLLHELCGRPLIGWTVDAARKAGADKVIVVDGPDRALNEVLHGQVELAVQERPLGTADAVSAASA